MSSITYKVKNIMDMSESEIAECARLFSNNYGYYRDDAPHKAGNRIRMSPDFFRRRFLHEDVHIAVAKSGSHVVGQAVYIRKKYPKLGTMTWVLQLVVSEKHRKHGIGSRLLYSIWGMSDDFAWGLATANPCTVKALENATLRKCDPACIKKNLTEIKKLASEVGFVAADKYCVTDERSVVDTGFYVDNTEFMTTYQSIKDWRLGELQPGFEWLAFTFREQPIDKEKQSKHFEEMLEFSEEKLQKAYSRMKIRSHAWAKGTVNEINHLLSVTELGKGSSILDVGCAIGRHSYELYDRGFSVKGIDNSVTHIRTAKERRKKANKGISDNTIEFEVADIRTYGDRKKYDMVMALYDVIGSYPDYHDNEHMLEQMARRVKKRGFLAISVMNMELTQSIALPEQTGDVHRNIDLLYKLKPSFTMQETGNVFQPEYLVLDESSHVVFRKEQFGNDQELPAEDIVRDYRFTMKEICGLVEKYGFDVVDARYVQAGHFDRGLMATDSKAKEILIIGCKR